MSSSIENGAVLQELPDKSQISGKRQGILMLEIEKIESKNLKTFQKLLEQVSHSPQYNESRQSQSRKENVDQETDQELCIPGNTDNIPK